jgi:hypothetical protein
LQELALLLFLKCTLQLDSISLQSKALVSGALFSPVSPGKTKIFAVLARI